ncbi:MAG: retropepsin-like aspartic protease family protein [Shimia sp.]
MTGDDIASLVGLTFLLLVIGGGFLLSQRIGMGQALKNLLTWVLIFIGFIAAYALWDDVQGEFQPTQAVMQGNETVLTRAGDGHFYATLDVNEVPVRFLVDSGATDVVLTRADAMRAGINVDDLAFLGRAYTANGVVETASVALDSIGDGPGLRASVNGGELGISLLGMEYLERFSRIEIEGREMRLIP